jgi:tetratricopeptide (TPR) repeat protein
VSEDLNVEHLLDVFTSIDQHMDGIWATCYHFMDHLVWHKPRQTVLRPRIEGLPDSSRYKPKCLFALARLFEMIGNDGERKKRLVCALELERQRGDDDRVAKTLQDLADANRQLGFHKEGIQQAREGLEIYERIGDTIGQAECLYTLSWLLFQDGQPNDVENTASRAIDLASDKGREYLVTQLHRILGHIHRSKGRKEKAIQHYNTALGIASPRNFDSQLFWIHFCMAQLFRQQREYDNTHAHLGQAKSYAGQDVYKLGRAVQLQAEVWYLQHRLEDAKSEAEHALENYEKTGSSRDAEFCRTLLRKIEKAMKDRSTGLQGMLLEMMIHSASVDFHLTCQHEEPPLALQIPLKTFTTDLANTLFLTAVFFVRFSSDTFIASPYLLQPSIFRMLSLLIHTMYRMISRSLYRFASFPPLIILLLFRLYILIPAGIYE